ncbi:DMT family transporter [Pseudolysobacter antarcticus]|uniref:DMT family transporter n=1 Tax=Pseudolysobacter antarcticus TaxID=2511995 RepID=A0A411HQE6_9GAMM|nr:DMT family transporter [Pseudolysobacter antarcticus]
MIGFAANSLLCRLALRDASIDALSFTAIRIVSGALFLIALMLFQRKRIAGNWISALALATYAVAFSLAYAALSAGTGAVILFGCVQFTMIAVGLARNERPAPLAWLGLGIGLVALIALVAPGISAPPLFSALLMALAGASWAIYSLRGRGAGDAIANTAGNFLRASPLVIAMLVFQTGAHLSSPGVIYALLSGVVASGIGYVLWYTALPGLSAFRAATVQLAVPVVAALGGILLLDESLTLRLLLAGSAILGGIILATLVKSRSVATSHAPSGK